MLGTIAYLLYLKGLESAAKSAHKYKVQRYNNKVDAWHAAHGFPSTNIQVEISRYVWNNRAKVYEEMTGKKFFEGYFDRTMREKMEEYVTNKRGYKYFNSRIWIGDPSYKAAIKFK